MAFFADVKTVLRKTWDDINNNHIMALAAGLSYYFVLSLFPGLIFAAAVLSYLPIPHLFDTILGTMAKVVPPESMGLVRTILAGVLKTKSGGLLTAGVLGTLWSISSGFTSMIEALNVAYDVPETRPVWKTRLLGIALTFVIGGLMVAAAAVMLVGPRFGDWLSGLVGLTPVFAKIWPVLRWVAAIAFTVIAIELLFFLAPNVKQRFTSSLPGAAIGVIFWLGTSELLSIYFRSFANFNKTYGTLAAGIALLVWLYWSAFALLVGAEINAEIVQLRRGGTLPLKEKPPAAVKPRSQWEEKPAA